MTTQTETATAVHAATYLAASLADENRWTHPSGVARNGTPIAAAAEHAGRLIVALEPLVGAGDFDRLVDAAVWLAYVDSPAHECSTLCVGDSHDHEAAQA